MIVVTRSAVDAIGSSVCGSPIIARLAAPPLAGAASAEPVASVSEAAAARKRTARIIGTWGRLLRMAVRSMILLLGETADPAAPLEAHRGCVIKLHQAASVRAFGMTSRGAATATFT